MPCAPWLRQGPPQATFERWSGLTSSIRPTANETVLGTVGFDANGGAIQRFVTLILVAGLGSRLVMPVA